ncbi:MAG: excisionase family DNA-binding protein [Candidatus Dormibacteria bacterium]
MAEDREILSVEEAADWLGVGRSKVYELIGQGELAVLRMGRRTCIPTEVLREFARAHTTVAGVPVHAAGTGGWR